MIDANVVGAGPNGLAAAVTLARAGLDVVLTEASDRVGGGTQTRELVPGYRYDVCSAVHPAGIASPFFRAWGLEKRVRMIVPELSYAHPLDDGRAGIAWRDLDRTADGLGVDGPQWRRVFAPLVKHVDGLVDFTGHPLLRIPRDPVAAIWTGARALEFGTTALATQRFQTAEAQALIAGVAAHSNHRQPTLATAGAALLLATHGHARGWPVPEGGSQAIADALAADFEAHGGRIRLGTHIDTADQLEPSRVTLLDTTPKHLAGFTELPGRYVRALERFKSGQAVFKIDLALSGPIPWTNPEVAKAPTVHVGGSYDEIVAAEHEVSRGRIPDRPYVLLVQPTVVDRTRAPAGGAVLWAYTHVPYGWQGDLTEAMIAQIERFAPGIRDLIVGSTSMAPADFERHNASYPGGDVFSGEFSMLQLLKRPIISPTPWRTPVRGLYLCSASTSPGPAVHGMNGYLAAKLALNEQFGVRRVSFR